MKPRPGGGGGDHGYYGYSHGQGAGELALSRRAPPLRGVHASAATGERDRNAISYRNHGNKGANQSPIRGATDERVVEPTTRLGDGYDAHDTYDALDGSDGHDRDEGYDGYDGYDGYVATAPNIRDVPGNRHITAAERGARRGAAAIESASRLKPRGGTGTSTGAGGSNRTHGDRAHPCDVSGSGFYSEEFGGRFKHAPGNPLGPEFDVEPGHPSWVAGGVEAWVASSLAAGTHRGDYGGGDYADAYDNYEVEKRHKREFNMGRLSEKKEEKAEKEEQEWEEGERYARDYTAGRHSAAVQKEKS